MATVFEVTLGLGCLALLFLLYDVRRIRSDLGTLQRVLHADMAVLSASVGAETATQRRELVTVVRAVEAPADLVSPAAPTPAPSSSTKPVARPAARRLAQRIAEGQDAARARLKLPELAPVPPPAAELEAELEERTTVLELKKTPPAVLKNTGYRWVGTPSTKKARRSDPPVAITTEPQADPLDRDALAAPPPELFTRIGDDEKTPPSGTAIPIQVGRVPVDEVARRRAQAYPAFRTDEYPKIEVPAPHRNAGPGGG